MRYVTHAVVLLIIFGVFFITTVSADLRGDINGDGRADALDALLILQEVAGFDAIADAPHWWTLPVPDELVISRTGCTITGDCLDFPAYFVPGDLPQVVVFENSSWLLVLHELCHAHQWSVAGGGEWLETDEARLFERAAVDESNTMRRHPEVSLVEFFASMCANYYEAPQRLRDRAPELYAWFKESLP